MNLSEVNDWNREWPFIDIFKHSRKWIAQKSGGGGRWNTGEKLQLTAEGWPILRPGQAAATLMCRNMDGHYPAGSYVLTYDGTGVVTVGFDAVTKVPQGKNRFVVKVNPGNAGFFLRIDESDPTDPIRNIRVWMPGHANKADSPFHPLFVERLRPFKIIRFMNWQRTNNQKLARWVDRTTPDSIRQSGPYGVALEYMIALCNKLNAAPWFCMPHLANDNFVRRFATMVKQRLRPDLKIYVEWSNETWNTLFSQGKWVFAQAKQRGIQPPYVTADEARRDFKIWHAVFDAEKARVIRIAAGHQNNPWTTQQILKRLDGEFDAVSCSAYFWCSKKDRKLFDDQTTAEQLLRSAIRNINQRTLPLIRRHRAFADQWQQHLGRPIRLVAYEAGQGIIPIGGYGGGRRGLVPWKQAAWDCQAHPLMFDAYIKMLRGCRELGMDAFMAFTYVGAQTKWGSWGHLQYQEEPVDHAPKYRALLQAASAGAERSANAGKAVPAP